LYSSTNCNPLGGSMGLIVLVGVRDCWCWVWVWFDGGQKQSSAEAGMLRLKLVAVSFIGSRGNMSAGGRLSDWIDHLSYICFGRVSHCATCHIPDSGPGIK
jgi:hypothetical protein